MSRALAYSAMAVLAGIIVASNSSHLHAQNTSSTPAESAELIVRFKSIQREPAIVDMLADSDLRLEQLRWKHVGSGGGGIGARGPYGIESHKTVEEVFDDAEFLHRSYFESKISGGDKAHVTECPVDDSTAPVVDIHGVPGDPVIELACGIRVVEIHLAGPAGAATKFESKHGAIADIHRAPLN